jgi:hypothetical protein
LKMSLRVKGRSGMIPGLIAPGTIPGISGGRPYCEPGG